MIGEAGARSNRPGAGRRARLRQLGMHALRPGVQAVELLTTGRVTLPVPEPDRSYLRSVRRGEVPLAEVLAEVLAAVTDAEQRLGASQESRDVPTEPDTAWVEGLAAPLARGVPGADRSRRPGSR